MVRASACPTVEASFSSFCFMLFLELGQVTLSWNRKGDALCLCGQKRYSVVVHESGDFNGLRKQEGVDTTTGTLMLMTVTFKGCKVFSSHVQMQRCQCGVTGGQGWSRVIFTKWRSAES